jgi:excisionase family DNA binding protein
MELTEIQAAEFLQVPFPYLVKLIQTGKLPCRIEGTHRLIKLIDLMTYRLETEAVSDAAREQMTRDAEAREWGY